MLQYSIKKYIQCAFIYFSFNITDKNKIYQDTLKDGSAVLWILDWKSMRQFQIVRKKMLKTWSYYLLAYVTHLNYFWEFLQTSCSMKGTRIWESHSNNSLVNSLEITYLYSSISDILILQKLHILPQFPIKMIY